MGRKRRRTIDSKKDEPSGDVEESNDALLERIRQLEEDNSRLEESNNRLEGDVNRLKKENEIFRKILRTNQINADDALAEFLESGTDSVLEELRDLRRKVDMNSSNSSKPPSSDGYRKPSPKSLRVKTGRKVGGQPGHKGHNLVVPHEPDEFIDHYPEGCQSCPNIEICKSKGVLKCTESRDVIELELKVKVIEHRSFCAKCPCLGGENAKGAFPENVTAHVQYGDSFAIAAGVLDSFGYISDSRNAAILSALSGTTISSATIEALTERCAEKVSPALEKIHKELKEEYVTHHDETGTRIAGILGWIHNTSSLRYTIQTVHRKRGGEGIDAHGAVPREDGISAHDCWAPYFKYGGKHAICCAHLLRELTGIEEYEPEHSWPTMFKDHLLFMKSMADASRECGRTSLGEDALEYCSERYDEIMAIAEGECPMPPDRHPNTRGRKKKGKERALLERIIKLKDSISLFVNDLKVPFDNNQAERDVRYVKVKSKVSGGFRTIEGAQKFLDVSSYLITARKNGIGAFEALRLAFEGMSESVIPSHAEAIQ